VIIPKRIKHPFLTSEHIQNEESATITDQPTILSAEESKFGKEQTLIIVQLKRDGETYRWTLNSTSNDRLVNAFGEEGDAWVGKTVKIQKRSENIRGQERSVLYAVVTKTKENVA
jgi:hypothetical protein